MFHDNYQDLITQEQPIIKEPHHHDDIFINPITQYSQAEDVDVTFRRYLRVRKPIMFSYFVMYL
jgi:hypothetical protein